MASCLPVKEIMNDTCQHCGELIVGNAYRVTSEDQGIPLLDMVVCSLCFMEAKRLHLHAEEINLRGKQASARNRANHHPRLGI
jgi:RNase P subunit RPR2